MQEHIKLEVSLEVINKEIARTINKLRDLKDDKEIENTKKLMNELLELQEKAYKGDRQAIEKILTITSILPKILQLN